jgi:hypothetical protein
MIFLDDFSWRSWRLSHVAKNVLRQRDGDDRGGFGPENPRAQTHRPKVAGRRLPQFIFAPTTFRRDAEAELIDGWQFGRDLGQTFPAAFGNRRKTPAR